MVRVYGVSDWMRQPPAGGPGPAAPLVPQRDEGAGLVLIVDDVPDNLAVLHDMLDESGYTVLVATDGASAIARAAQARPDIVLLDAMMPDMDGFEVARHLKAGESTAAIPIVFMTALTETEHVLAAFDAGAVDYVSKPVRPREVVARIEAQLKSARHARHARHALDAFGHASIALRPVDGRVLWQTPLARELMRRHFGTEAIGAAGVATGAPVGATRAHASLCEWVRARSSWKQALDDAHRGSRWIPAPARPGAVRAEAGHTWSFVTGHHRLECTLHPAADENEWLIVLTESSSGAAVQALALQFGLTAREAEVLYWVAQGKTSRDIADILGTRPRTITKHLERIFEKLGVETRTAAASRVFAIVPESVRER